MEADTRLQPTAPMRQPPTPMRPRAIARFVRGWSAPLSKHVGRRNLSGPRHEGADPPQHTGSLSAATTAGGRCQYPCKACSGVTGRGVWLVRLLRQGHDDPWSAVRTLGQKGHDELPETGRSRLCRRHRLHVRPQRTIARCCRGGATCKTRVLVSWPNCSMGQ